MSKFRKGGKKTMTAISTASLPDIVFMLLFFFMVTTVMRETELKVELKTPSASEIVKIKNKSEISTIYIGKPTQSIYDKNSTKIQFAKLDIKFIRFMESKDGIRPAPQIVNTIRKFPWPVKMTRRSACLPVQLGASSPWLGWWML